MYQVYSTVIASPWDPSGHTVGTREQEGTTANMTIMLFAMPKAIKFFVSEKKTKKLNQLMEEIV